MTERPGGRVLAISRTTVRFIWAEDGVEEVEVSTVPRIGELVVMSPSKSGQLAHRVTDVQHDIHHDIVRCFLTRSI